MIVTAAVRAGGFVRRNPLACAVVVAVLAAGAVTGTLVTPVADLPSVHRHAYGLPALASGHWFSLLAGSLIVPRPLLYPVVAVLLGLAVGFVERRAGGARTAAVLVVTQLVGVLGAACLLLVSATAFPWPWADALATQTDTGMSAGAVGMLAAATAVMGPTWRARIRWAVGGYLTIMVLRSGLLWDVEHALGFAAGLGMGPLLRAAGAAPAPPVHRPRLARIRGALALFVLLMPVSSLVMTIYPGNGGVLGPGEPQGPHRLVPALIELAVALVISKALRRGLPGSWWAALGFAGIPLALAAVHLLAAGPVLTLASVTARAGDIVCWGAVVAALIVCRGCWPWRLPAVVLRRYLPRLVAATVVFAGIWWLVVMLAGPEIGVHPRERGRAVFGAVTLHQMAHSDVRWVRFAMGLSGWVWAVTLVALLVPMVLAARDARRAGDPDGARLRELVRRHGGGSLGWQRTWPGFTAWTTRAGDVAIGYRIVSGVALVLGDPVGPPARWADAVAEFRRFCLRAGWTVCWYAVTPAFAESAGDDWHLTQIGEDAVLDLAGLQFRGRSWQDVRTARNSAAREGIRMRRVIMAEASPQLRRQIAEVSRGWNRTKPLPEMGFTLGTVEHARDPQMRTHIAVGPDGTVHGVTTWLPVHEDGRVVGWTLDVMRRRVGGFRPVIEFLIAESALAFRSEGCRTVSLSVAPLARAEATGDGCRAARPGRLERVLDRVSRMLEPAYGFRSLLEFKRKFHPAFSPVYLGYADEIDLSQITVAIGKAYLPHLTVGQAARVVRTLVRRPGGRHDRRHDGRPGTRRGTGRAGREGGGPRGRSGAGPRASADSDGPLGGGGPVRSRVDTRAGADGRPATM